MFSELCFSSQQLIQHYLSGLTQEVKGARAHSIPCSLKFSVLQPIMSLKAPMIYYSVLQETNDIANDSIRGRKTFTLQPTDIHYAILGADQN